MACNLLHELYNYLKGRKHNIGKDSRDLIHVDPTKCTKCGSCAEVCPTGVICMDDHGLKVLNQFCIACGHCVHICQSATLDNVKKPLVIK